MLERIRRCATGRNVGIALVIFVTFLCAMNIAATLFYKSTGGYGILDLGGGANLFAERGGYTPAEAYRLIKHYGESGIHRYYALLVADTFFPPTLGTFAVLTIVWALTRLKQKRSGFYALALIPVAYTIADWSENIGIITLLTNYPHELLFVARATNIARGIKNVLADISVELTLTMSAMALLSYFWGKYPRRRH